MSKEQGRVMFDKICDFITEYSLPDLVSVNHQLQNVGWKFTTTMGQGSGMLPEALDKHTVIHWEEHDVLLVEGKEEFTIRIFDRTMKVNTCKGYLERPY